MKKIAFLSDGWKKSIDYLCVEGIMEGFRSHNEDVCVCQFNSNGNWSHDTKYNHGEYNIYNLPDLSEFDGIVLNCNTTVDMAQVENLIRIAKAANVPVINIGFDIDGFYYVGMDARRAIFALMDHLFREHNCRHFIFAGGPITNGENSVRADAFKEYLEIVGLPVAENPVLYGNFDFYSGIQHFRSISGGNRLPDAIVCANDNIAAGVCYEAQRMGYEVPGDFLVTGFDDYDKAKYFIPQITTVAYDDSGIGQMCAETFVDIWRTGKADTYNYIPPNAYFTESCGCPSRHDTDFRLLCENNVLDSVAVQMYEDKRMDFEADLVKCQSLEEIFECAGKFIRGLDCDGVYYAIDKRYFEASPYFTPDTDGYDPENIRIVYYSDSDTAYGGNTIKDIFNMVYGGVQGVHYMFLPMHFDEKVIGFCIIKNAKFVKEGFPLYDAQCAVNVAIWKTFKENQLNNALKTR